MLYLMLKHLVMLGYAPSVTDGDHEDKPDNVAN